MPQNPFENTLRKLRMNNMYGGGMPDLDRLEELAFALRNEEEMRGQRLRDEQESRQGRQMREKFKYDNIARINEHNRGVAAQPRLQQIAQSVAQPEINKPMNVVLGQTISPYQQAQLSARDKDRESREVLAGKRIAQGDTKIADAAAKTKDASSDRERRTQVLEGKAKLNTLTDKETIELKALNSANAATKSAGAAMDRVNRGGEIAGQRQEVIGAQGLQRIAATGKLANERQEDAQRETQDRDTRQAIVAAGVAADKRDSPESSFQQKTAIQIKMNKFKRENPEYDDLISLDENGYPDLSKIKDPGERERINLYLGNKRTKDINLPGSSSARPDPLGIR